MCFGKPASAHGRLKSAQRNEPPSTLLQYLVRDLGVTRFAGCCTPPPSESTLSYIESSVVIISRQTCTVLSDAIPNDRLFWAQTFNRLNDEQQSCVPSNVREMGQLDARDLGALPKREIPLDHAYKTPDGRLFVRKIEIRACLRVA